MRALKRLLWGTALASPVLALWFFNSSKASSPPGLSISLGTSNQISLVVTNGTNTGTYEIFYKELLDNTTNWNLWTTGTQGQTNFTIPINEDAISGFFKAVAGTNVISVSVTIELPVNGSTVY
ncbi:MAG TPA: hypothetical protein VKQ08_05170 [Cyclobacteriaceae bacterium]|nr:hypothetical protein [Cyclobacteriaceae bacterium]